MNMGLSMTLLQLQRDVIIFNVILENIIKVNTRIHNLIQSKRKKNSANGNVLLVVCYYSLLDSCQWRDECKKWRSKECPKYYCSKMFQLSIIWGLTTEAQLGKCQVFYSIGPNVSHCFLVLCFKTLMLRLSAPHVLYCQREQDRRRGSFRRFKLWAINLISMSRKQHYSFTDRNNNTTLHGTVLFS